MSIVFDLAEAINLLYGVILGEATPSIINKLRERATQKQIKDKLLLIVGNDRNLPDKVKEDLSILIKDSQFITTFLKLAVEMNSGSSDGPSIPSDGPVRENFEQRWESITSRLDKTIKTKVYENFRKVAIEAVIKTLSPADQHMHYMLSYLQIRMDQLQQTVQQDVAQQDVAQQAAIDELRSVINDIHEGIAGRRLGSLSVDDRVNQYFSLRDSLIPAVFMGRENEIDQINKFILEDNENCDQWWWWQADAWAGKTALMAHLASNPKPDVNVASVFIIGREPANADSDAFYSYLIPQLAKIAGLTWVEIPSDLQGRIAQLKNLIDAAAARSRPNNGRLVILVDGLDEDRGPYRETTKQSIAASLPNSLPTNVRVIVSSRRNPPLSIDIPDSHPLQDGIYRHPLEISEYAKAARKAAIDELKRIIKINDGSNRYGRDMLAFLAASGGWLTARDLAKLTKQDIYFIEEILKENATARSFRINHLSDGNLAYAIGHDLLDQLLVCEYLDEQIRLPLDQGADDQIKADRTKCDEDRARYEKDRYRALQPWRHKIAEWAEECDKLDWPSSTPDYLCSEAFADLLSRDPGLEKQALSTLTNQSRMNLLQSKHGNDYQSITQLQSFIDILADRITRIPSDSLTHLATALHFLDRLSQRTRNIPPELPSVFARLGKKEYAKSLALSIIEPKPLVSALCKLATALEKSKNTAEAYYIIELALIATNAIPDPQDKSKALIRVAAVLAKFGFTDKANIIAEFALNAANAITDPQNKSKAYVDVVTIHIKSGKITEAINLTKAIIDPYYKVQALIKFFNISAKSDKYAKIEKIYELLLSTVSTITDPFFKSQAFTNIAISVGKTGNASDATDLANALPEPDDKVRALAKVATSLPQPGNTCEVNKIIELALSTVNAITNPYHKAKALSEVAIALAQSGNPTDSNKTAKQILTIANAITDPYDKAYILANIATLLARLGNTIEATNLANTITDHDYKAQTLTDIAILLAKSGDTNKSTNLAYTITDHNYKAKALTGIASSLACAGNTSEAINIAELALTSANLITEPEDKAQCLVTVADALARSGNTSEATKISKLALNNANAITDSYNKSQTLARVAVRFSYLGNILEANEIIRLAFYSVNAIPISHFKIGALLGVATAFSLLDISTETGSIAELTLDTANAITNPYVKAQALANIAINLAKSSRTDEANKIVSAITNPYYKVLALSEVAIAYARYGNNVEANNIAELALTTTNTIKDPNYKTLALANIATAFKQFGNNAKANKIGELITNTVNVITDQNDKALCLLNVVAIFAISGNISEATNLANTIADSYQKAEVLAQVATKLAQSKKTTDAVKVAGLVLNTAKAIKGPDDKAHILAMAATVLAKSGNTDEAIKIAKLILDTADTITIPYEPCPSLSDIAIELAQSGKPTEAIKIANAIMDPYCKESALSAIAIAFVQFNNATELAFKIINEISMPYFREKTLGELAIIFSKNNLDNLLVKATLAMLMLARNPWQHYDVLLKVAEPTALAILPLLLDETEG